ncbi:hypothetical protein DPMN_107849 [Dreissena polymorpha]|uniref:Uncharacterized protein n=1 Tax=Dreissena polymorpha TaxID=45954 RepID=A0A9D4K7Y8_DREPO|nr:hypothetical protein DPMN_107849 [Dreissena polymorpha]
MLSCYLRCEPDLAANHSQEHICAFAITDELLYTDVVELKPLAANVLSTDENLATTLSPKKNKVGKKFQFEDFNASRLSVDVGNSDQSSDFVDPSCKCDTDGDITDVLHADTDDPLYAVVIKNEGP